MASKDFSDFHPSTRGAQSPTKAKNSSTTGQSSTKTSLLPPPSKKPQFNAKEMAKAQQTGQSPILTGVAAATSPSSTTSLPASDIVLSEDIVLEDETLIEATQDIHNAQTDRPSQLTPASTFNDIAPAQDPHSTSDSNLALATNPNINTKAPSSEFSSDQSIITHDAKTQLKTLSSSSSNQPSHEIHTSTKHLEWNSEIQRDAITESKSSIQQAPRPNELIPPQQSVALSEQKSIHMTHPPLVSMLSTETKVTSSPLESVDQNTRIVPNDKSGLNETLPKCPPVPINHSQSSSEQPQQVHNEFSPSDVKVRKVASKVSSNANLATKPGISIVPKTLPPPPRPTAPSSTVSKPSAFANARASGSNLKSLPSSPPSSSSIGSFADDVVQGINSPNSSKRGLSVALKDSHGVSITGKLSGMSDSKQVSRGRFMEACREGNVMAAQKILDEGILNVDEGYGQDLRTVLHDTVERGLYDMCRWLVIDRQAEVNCTDRLGYTPLHLLCARIKPYPVVEDGPQPYVEIANLLLENGARLDISLPTDEDPAATGDTPLHSAAHLGHICMVQIILSRPEVYTQQLLDRRNKYDYTPLILSCISNYRKCAELLIDCGANVNLAGSNGDTALHWACNMGNDMIAAVLLARGADIFACVRNGSTPLHWCVAEGHTVVAELLLSSNQRILELTDADGDTAVHWCCLKGHLDCAELLITRHGANVHAIDVGGYTPLLWAVEKKRTAIVDMLLKNGASSDILIKNRNGFNCLDMAMKKRNQAIHQRLLIELDGGLHGGCGAPCVVA